MNRTMLLLLFAVLSCLPAGVSAGQSTSRLAPKAKPPNQKKGAAPSKPAVMKARAHRSPRPAGQPRALAITNVAVQAKEGWLGAGSLIGVRVNGTAAAEAVFDIPGLAHGVKLQEGPAGQYASSFRVPGNRYVCLESAVLLAGLRAGDQQSAPAAWRETLKIDAAPPVIEEVYPKPSARVVRLRAPIVAHVSEQGGSGLAVERARIVLDEEDVSDSVVVINGYVSYLPPNDLEPGEHSVHLMVYDRAGNMRSQSWMFTIIDSQYSIRAVTTNADRALTAGESLTVNVEGMWGGKVALLIGDLAEVPLKEQSPGFYEGVYVVKALPAATAPLAIRFTSAENEQYVEALELPLRTPATISIYPAITHPADGGWAGDLLQVRGKGGARTIVKLRVAYRGETQGVPIRGIIAEQHIRVGADGLWESKSIEKSPLLARAAPAYEMSISTVGETGSQ